MLLQHHVTHQLLCFPYEHHVHSRSQPSSSSLLASPLPQVKVPLSVEGKPSGWLHLGVFLEREAGPGEAVGEVQGGRGCVGRRPSQRPGGMIAAATPAGSRWLQQGMACQGSFLVALGLAPRGDGKARHSQECA